MAQPPTEPDPWPGSPEDYVLVKRGVLIGAALILEKAVQRLFISGTKEAYDHMRDAARGPEYQRKKDWLK